MINILSTTAAEQFWAPLAIEFSVENLNNSQKSNVSSNGSTPNLPPQNNQILVGKKNPWLLGGNPPPFFGLFSPPQKNLRLPS